MIKLVFLGTPQIAVPTLEYFCKNTDIEVLAVITQPDKPAGRGNNLTASPIKILAQENNLNIFQPISIRKDYELIEKLKKLNADFFITVAFGQILSQEVIDIPGHGTINLHASLLPKYRGANPIQCAIVNGEKTTGITTMLTSLGVDEGDMLLSEKIEITENMNTAELSQKISQAGPELLHKSMLGLLNKEIKPVVQIHQEATHAPKFTKEDGLISWGDKIENIHNKVRGFYPWPSAYTNRNNELLKIIKTEKTNQCSGNTAGEIIAIRKEGIFVATSDGDIVLKIVQPQGKKEMDAFSWANGARISIGEILG